MWQKLKRKIKSVFKRKRPLNTYEEIMAAIRHECHRIEKSVYNNILNDKFKIYKAKKEYVDSLLFRLNEKHLKDPSMQWAKSITKAFPEIKNSFVASNKQPLYEFDKKTPCIMLDVLQARRSNRVWASKQPSKGTLQEHALKMIQAAITAPCSGNRQGVRYKIIIEQEERYLLTGLKEYHCYSAPLLIFIGVQKNVYYSLGKSDKNSKYLDAAASAMQIINYATSLNYGTCWNHFDKYLVNSRKKNMKAYQQFKSKLNIPDNIEPVALIAIGLPKFIVPTPVRMNLEYFMINN